MEEIHHVVPGFDLYAFVAAIAALLSIPKDTDLTLRSPCNSLVA